MALFEVKLVDGSPRLLNPDWLVMVSPAIESGTILEFYSQEDGRPARVFRAVEDYGTVKDRIDAALREARAVNSPSAPAIPSANSN